MQIIEITSEEAKRFIKEEGVILIDVRTPVEYELYRIEEGKVLNIPIEELKARNDELKGYKMVICICRTNRRSREAARTLSELGFNPVYVVKDGVLGWLKLSQSMSLEF